MVTPSASVNHIGPILREVDLKFEVGSHELPDPIVVRPLPYLDQWRTIVDKKWFSYKLEDHSVFSFDEEAHSYSYLPCPLDVISLREFSKARGVTGSDVYSSDNQLNYEIYLSTASVREHVAPVRFDLDRRGFNHECHPLGHVHIGHDSQMRIGTERSWTPLSFFLFILRQNYPGKWKVLLTRPSAAALPSRVRGGLRVHDEAFLKPIFSRECFLS